MININMTVPGYSKLKNTLLWLRNVKFPNIISLILEFKKKKYKNYAYQAAIEAKKICAHKIKELELKLLNYDIIDVNTNKHNMTFYSTVTLQQLDTNKVFKYKIVSDHESYLQSYTISINSPLYNCVIGKTAGDILELNTQFGMLVYKII